LNKNKQPILLLAETGFIIRNLLLGYFVDEICKERPLVVAVLNPEDEGLKNIIKGKPITLIPFPKEFEGPPDSYWKRFWGWDNVMYQIKMGKKSNASLKLQTRLFEGKSNVRSALMMGIVQFVCRLVKYIPALDKYIENRYLFHYISKKEVTRGWKKTIDELKPCAVFSSMLTHSYRYRCSTDLPVLVAAQELGIASCTLVQSWDNLSSKTSVLPPWLKAYYTWSPYMSEELIRYNPWIPVENISVVGSPQFDFHLDKKLLEDRVMHLTRLGLDPDRPYVLIGTGTPKWMPDEMEKTIALCRKLKEHLPQVQTLIRLHPKDNNWRWDPFLDELKQLSVKLQYSSPLVHMDFGGFVPPTEFYKDQVNAIYHSSVVINSSSSLTIDAAILDKPVICVAYDLNPDALFPEGRALAYTTSAHYSVLVNTKGVAMAHSEKECLEQIENYIKNPTLHQAERAKLVATVASHIDMHAGELLAKQTLNMVSSLP
jgi:hypothetical protein